jgi:hypothetical protein
MLKYSFNNYNLDNQEIFNNLLYKLHSEFPFSDIYNVSEPVDIKTHTHSDIESRLFLTGYAIFNIDGTEISCCPGTYVCIDANIPHSFSYSGGEPLKVIRFFKNNKTWKADFA